MIARNSKIARLPGNIREELNHRLRNGEPGNRLVEWLNSLSDTHRVLAQDFEGRPINEQNLSEWRQGGYQDWLKQQERRKLVRQLAEDAGELQEEAGGLEASHHLAAVLTAELAETAQELLETTTEPKERWVRLQELLQELSRLRREDCRAGRLQIAREHRAQERAKETSDAEWQRQHALSNRLIRRSFLSSYFAKPDMFSQAMAFESAESLLLEAESGSDEIRPNQTESN